MFQVTKSVILEYIQHLLSRFFLLMLLDEDHHDCTYKKSGGHHDRDCSCVSGDERLDRTAGQQPDQVGSRTNSDVSAQPTESTVAATR